MRQERIEAFRTEQYATADAQVCQTRKHGYKGLEKNHFTVGYEQAGAHVALIDLNLGERDVVKHGELLEVRQHPLLSGKFKEKWKHGEIIVENILH